MRIRWDRDRKKWLVFPGEITATEQDLLQWDGLSPGYYDNWESGDVYFYERNFPVGELINFCDRLGLHLDILY